MKGLIGSAAALALAVPALGAYQISPAQISQFPGLQHPGGVAGDASGDTFTAAILGEGGAAGMGALLDGGGPNGNGTYTFGGAQSMGNVLSADPADDIVITTSETNVGNTFTLSIDITGDFIPVDGLGITDLTWQGGFNNFGAATPDGIGSWPSGFAIVGGTWNVYDEVGNQLIDADDLTPGVQDIDFVIGSNLLDGADIGGDSGVVFQTGVFFGGDPFPPSLLFGMRAEIVVTKIPAPGVLAMFGLVGLAGTRRRR